MDVVYIVGKGRSGSTILDSILGQIPDVVSLGELRQIWRGLDRQAYHCSCGQKVMECPRWSRALADAFGGPPSSDQLAAAEELQRSFTSWLNVLPLLVRSLRTPSFRRRLSAYTSLTLAVYTSVADHEDGIVALVDSSKLPLHPALVGDISVRTKVIHLVRDPRAVAFSYRRSKETHGLQPAMPRFSAAHSALSWLARQLVLEVAHRRFRGDAWTTLRYEDFAANPQEQVERLRKELGLETEAQLFSSGGRLEFGPSHLVGGNPGRFQRGEIEIRPDNAWETGLKPGQRRIVDIITAPLLGRFGYAR